MRRRDFLAVTGALVLPRPGRAAQEARVRAADRITVGMIGVGRQAHHYNLRSFLDSPDAQVVAVCDVDAWRLEQARDTVESHYAGRQRAGTFKGCSVHRDFRDLLARGDIDAVMISTPDHWHVPISIAAVRAGKDVCCEKPLTRSIEEGRLLSDAVTRHKRVFRTDSEFRSLKNFHRACELVRNGRIGKLHTIRVGVPGTDVALPQQPAMPVPDELDYELWLGPAPREPYTVTRVHPPKDFSRPGWMRVRDYCDGMITNWGAHLCDIAQWGNNTDRTGPVEVEGTGTFPPADGLWNVLLEFDLSYRYADGTRLFYKTDKPYVRFEGSEGWIYAEYTNILQAEPASVLESEIGPDEIHFPLRSEKVDFLEAVKTRSQTLADAEVGHRTMSLCHIGHIAVQVGKPLKWDPETERFTNSDAANRMLARPMRDPWGLPT